MVGKVAHENTEDSRGNNFGVSIGERKGTGLGGESGNAKPILREVLFLDEDHESKVKGRG